MAKFALICEGVIDQIAISNILCGFFDNEDLDEDIAFLQPPYDVTTQKQKYGEFGGWLMLLSYLAESRFRDAVLSNRYVVVHVDTDISEKKGFDVAHRDENNQELSVELLVQKVIMRLIEQINANEPGFYQTYKDRIVFCISVHSLECWLLAHYTPNIPSKPKIKGCVNTLKNLVENRYSSILEKAYPRKKRRNFSKERILYEHLSEPFLDGERLRSLTHHEPSLQIFLTSLEAI